MEGLRLPTAHADGSTVFAALPHRQLMGQEYREGLEHDYRRLSQSGATAIRLDLRAVEFIDGAFPGRLVGLARAVAAKRGRLTVEASPNLAEIFRITKLDRLLEVVWDDGPQAAGPVG